MLLLLEPTPTHNLVERPFGGSCAPDQLGLKSLLKAEGKAQEEQRRNLTGLDERSEIDIGSKVRINRMEGKLGKKHALFNLCASESQAS